MKIKYATVLLLASALPFWGLTGRTTLTPSQPSGAQGDVVNVEVHFSSDTTEVVGAQFTLTYDPAVMTAGEISTGTAVSNHEVFDEQSSGKISVTLLSMSNDVFTTGTLATISFTLESAVSEETSSVSLVEAETLLVTKAGEKESYEAIQKINDLFVQYAAQGEASKPSTARSITFSATGDGSDATYLWDFGDGTTMTGKDASHVYKTPSSYLITMTATNFLGSKTSSKRVTVEAPYWALDATDLGWGGSLSIGSASFTRLRTRHGCTMKSSVGSTGTAKPWTTPGCGRTGGSGPGRAIRSTPSWPTPMQSGFITSTALPTRYATTITA